MTRIRILLAGGPRLLLDVLHQVVASEPDMAVVGRVSRRELPAAVQRTRPDVVLVGQKTDDQREAYVQLLLQRPHLRIVAITEDGNSGSLYELGLRRVRLREISALALCSEMRGRRTGTPEARRNRVETG